MEEKYTEELAQANNFIDKTQPQKELQPIEEILNEQYEIPTYRMLFGTDKKYVPYKAESYWYCGCGELNQIGEKTCHKCNQELEKLLAGLDKSMLCLEYLYRISIGKHNSNSVDELEASLKNLEIIGNYKDSLEIAKQYKDRITTLQMQKNLVQPTSVEPQGTTIVQPTSVEPQSTTIALDATNEAETAKQLYPEQPQMTPHSSYYNNQKTTSKAGSVIQWILIIFAILIVGGILGGSYPLMKYNEYQNAVRYYEAGAYEKAAELFDDLNGYKNSGELYFKAYNALLEEKQAQKEEETQKEAEKGTDHKTEE